MVFKRLYLPQLQVLLHQAGYLCLEFLDLALQLGDAALGLFHLQALGLKAALLPLGLVQLSFKFFAPKLLSGTSSAEMPSLTPQSPILRTTEHGAGTRIWGEVQRLGFQL